MFWIEFIVLMLIIVWGTRKGGSFLAMAGGIGMLIFVYIFRVTPSDPPITVILDYVGGNYRSLYDAGDWRIGFYGTACRKKYYGKIRKTLLW